MKRLILLLAPLLLAACATTQYEPSPQLPGGVTEWRGWNVAGDLAPEPWRTQAAALWAGGHVSIHERTAERLPVFCQRHNVEPGLVSCSNPLSSGTCIVYVLDTLPDWYQRETAALHEAAHCAGWPADHRGATNPTPAMLEEFR